MNKPFTPGAADHVLLNGIAVLVSHEQLADLQRVADLRVRTYPLRVVKTKSLAHAMLVGLHRDFETPNP